MAENVMSMWAQFACPGDLSVDGLVDGPPQTEESPRYLDIGREMEVRDGIGEAYVAPPED